MGINLRRVCRNSGGSCYPSDEPKKDNFAGMMFHRHGSLDATSFGAGCLVSVASRMRPKCYSKRREEPAEKKQKGLHVVKEDVTFGNLSDDSLLAINCPGRALRFAESPCSNTC